MDAWWIWIVAPTGVVLVLLALGAWRLARHRDPEMRSLVERVYRLPWRGKARLAWALLRDRRIPLWLRALVPAVILYLLTPVDIIPDFIPVLGHLDDAMVLLVAGEMLVRFTPRAVLEDHIARLEAATVPDVGPAA